MEQWFLETLNNNTNSCTIGNKGTCNQMQMHASNSYQIYFHIWSRFFLLTHSWVVSDWCHMAQKKIGSLEPCNVKNSFTASLLTLELLPEVNRCGTCVTLCSAFVDVEHRDSNSDVKRLIVKAFTNWINGLKKILLQYVVYLRKQTK